MQNLKSEMRLLIGELKYRCFLHLKLTNFEVFFAIECIREIIDIPSLVLRRSSQRRQYGTPYF